nr:hypothetical protein [Micromonospora sp. DSM 115978]
GWLFVVGYAITAVGVVSADYGKLASPGEASTSQHVANWIGNVAGAQLVIPIFCFIALLFPDGTLPSGRWRIASWVNGVNIAAAAVLVAVASGWPTRARSEADLELGDTMESLLSISFFLIVIIMVVAIASLVVRLRTATGDRRRQLLWLLVAAAYLAVGVAGIGPRDALATVGVPVWSTQLVLFLGPSAIPLAAGVAIFRSRLY